MTEAAHGCLGARVLALVMLLTPLIASAASGWWNDDWQHRKALTVRLQPGGADLRFVAGDGTPLKHQIEMLDPAAGLLIAWIEIPVTGNVA